MTARVIELSNSSYNGTSSLLSTIILAGFLLFTVKTGGKLYNKLNPTGKYKDPSIFNAVVQNTTKTIQHLMDINTTKAMDDLSTDYKTRLSELKTTVQMSSSYATAVSTIMGGINKQIYDNFVANLTKLQTFLDNSKSVVGKITDLSNKNADAFDTAYAGFQTVMQKYIRDIVTMMSAVVTQISQASVIKPLFAMVTPLKRVYDSMYETLTSNLPFIQKMDSSFDMSQIPAVNTSINPNLGADFKLSSAILQQSGYK